MSWREYRYHVYHRRAFDRLRPWAAAEINVPGPPPLATERKRVYSLKKDMDQLRLDGAAKGIVDAAVQDVGESREGRKLWALKVGNGAGHKVLFNGCHHAREWISVEIPYLVAEYLIRTYTPNPATDVEKRIKHLLMNREIWFVPLVNPDGHEYTMHTDRTWRPNRQSYALGPGIVNRAAGNGGDVNYDYHIYTGVDINRNYATARWGIETFSGHTVRTSQNPDNSGAQSLWCGPLAGSERETAAMQTLINTGFRGSISYHSYGELLLAPDAMVLDGYLDWVGKGMETLISGSGHDYTYGTPGPPMDILYAATGSHMDYCLERAPDRPTFIPEVRPSLYAHSAWPSGDGFSGLPESEIEPTFRENLGAALALINCAGHDHQAPGKTIHTVTGSPATKCQAVRHCWEVFRGWPLP